MKPMIWHPEEKDARVNEYLSKVNHAPYGAIVAMSLGLFCLFTIAFLLISF